MDSVWFMPDCFISAEHKCLLVVLLSKAMFVLCLGFPTTFTLTDTFPLFYASDATPANFACASNIKVTHFLSFSKFYWHHLKIFMVLSHLNSLANI